MWTCPKCGRAFKRTNQGHYCGKAPETIDEYIASQPDEARKHLTELRKVIHSCVPDVREWIAWSMPYFGKGENSISMAAFKKHISFYVDQEMTDMFLQQTTQYTVKKNAIYLPYNKPLPTEILETVVKQSFQLKEK